MWLLFHRVIASVSFLLPLTEFPQLSDLISSGRPLRAINLLKKLINDGVWTLYTISTCTALIDKHGSSTTYMKWAKAVNSSE